MVGGAERILHYPWDELLVLAPSAATFGSAFLAFFEARAVFLLALGSSAGAPYFFAILGPGGWMAPG